MISKVFISHSSTDTWVVKQIQTKISGLGVSTFLDEDDIHVGDDFEEIILKELEDSDELLVLLTPWALERPYIWLEIGVALSKSIRVIGILYGITNEQFQTNSKLPLFIKKHNLIDLNQFEKYLTQLQTRITQ